MPSDFWPDDLWPSSLDKPKKIQDLKMFLSEELTKRKPDVGYISKCILKPEKNYVSVRLFSLLKAVAQKVGKHLQPWISTQKVGLFRPGETPSANIFIADFVDLNHFEFCK